MGASRSKWRAQNCRTAADRDRRSVPERQNQPARGPSGARRRRGAARLGARRHQRRRFQPRSARPRDERRAQRRQRRLHGRPLHLLRLPRLGRIHPRHALRPARLRRGGGRVRSRSAQDAGAAGHPARTRRARACRASCSSTRSISPAAACARRSRCCSRPRARRCCCARCRSGRTASPPASSTSRSSAPSSIASRGPPSVVEMPAGVARDEKQARYSMLEKLADYDDALMEQLISDIEPPRDRVFDDLAKELRDGHVVPLLMGSATAGHGVTRLLKALRHEAPGVTQTRARLGVEAKGPALAQVDAHNPHRPRRQAVAGAGAARRFRRRRGGGRLARQRGAHRRRRAADRRGVRQAAARRGRRHRRLRAARKPAHRRPLQRRQEAARAPPRLPPPPPPTQAIAIQRQGPQGRGAARRRAGQAVRGGPLARLCPGPGIGRTEAVRPGRDAPARDRRAARRPLRRRRSRRRSRRSPIAKRSATRSRCAGGTRSSRAATASSATWWSRSAPRDRGEGFAFAERVHGGTVPRQYFSSVEMGARDAMNARAARLSGRRRRRDADRRLLPHRQFLRHGVPRRDASSRSPRRCPRRARCCSSRSSR